MSETQATWLLVMFLFALAAIGMVSLWIHYDRILAAGRSAMARMERDQKEMRDQAQALADEGNALRSEASLAAGRLDWMRADALMKQAGDRYRASVNIYKEFERRVRSGTYRYP